MQRSDVRRWVEDYETAWRTAGTGMLTDLFAPDATYLVSPWAETLHGLEAIAGLWEAERVGPDEPFTMTSDLVAVEDDVAVLRVEVSYDATGHRWRDLWIVRFDDDGRCHAFEEWPFAPEQPDGH